MSGVVLQIVKANGKLRVQWVQRPITISEKRQLIGFLEDLALKMTDDLAERVMEGEL